MCTSLGKNGLLKMFDWLAFCRHNIATSDLNHKLTACYMDWCIILPSLWTKSRPISKKQIGCFTNCVSVELRSAGGYEVFLDVLLHCNPLHSFNRFLLGRPLHKLSGNWFGSFCVTVITNITSLAEGIKSEIFNCCKSTNVCWPVYKINDRYSYLFLGWVGL